MFYSYVGIRRESMRVRDDSRGAPHVRRRDRGSKATRRSRSRTPPTSRASPRSGDAARRDRAGDRRGPAQVRRGVWADRSRAPSGPRRCTPSSTTSRRTRDDARRDDGRRGRPADDVRRARCSRHGVTLARDTIDLYLSMPHEEANPVPVDELVARPGRAERPPARAGRRRRRDHAVQRRVHHGVPEDDARADGRQLGDPAPEPADADLVARLRRGRATPPASRPVC